VLKLQQAGNLSADLALKGRVVVLAVQLAAGLQWILAPGLLSAVAEVHRHGLHGAA
jgi:hypothetical protein